jgi:hypothetical protein
MQRCSGSRERSAWRTWTSPRIGGGEPEDERRYSPRKCVTRVVAAHGVEELRTLVSSMIQSEKWGTSIATVLRVAAETLRRKRRQTAEKEGEAGPAQDDVSRWCCSFCRHCSS